MIRTITTTLMLSLFLLVGTTSSLELVKLVVHVVTDHVSHDHDFGAKTIDETEPAKTHEDEHGRDHSHDKEIAYYTQLAQIQLFVVESPFLSSCVFSFVPIFSYFQLFSDEFGTSVFRPPIHS